MVQLVCNFILGYPQPSGFSVHVSVREYHVGLTDSPPELSERTLSQEGKYSSSWCKDVGIESAVCLFYLHAIFNEAPQDISIMYRHKQEAQLRKEEISAQIEDLLFLFVLFFTSFLQYLFCCNARRMFQAQKVFSSPLLTWDAWSWCMTAVRCMTSLQLCERLAGFSIAAHVL